MPTQTQHSTINVRDEDGKLLNLQTRIVEFSPTLNQRSIVELISTPTGNGFTGGDVVKKTKKTLTNQVPELDPAQITSGFVGASAQKVRIVNIGKIIREENMIFSMTDLIKLREGKGGDVIAQNTSEFLLANRERDLNFLIANGLETAKNMKIFSSADANGKPTGVQPTQTDFTTAGAIKDMLSGCRVVSVEDLDVEKGDGIRLARTAASYLNTIGSLQNKGDSVIYPHSINGISTGDLAFVTTYAMASSMFRDNLTQNFIQISNGDQKLNYAGQVANIDGMPVYITNQVPADTLFVCMSRRAFARDLDPNNQYIGQVRTGGGFSTKLSNNQQKNVKPSEVVVSYEQGRAIGVKFPEEIIQVKLKEKATP